LESQFRQQLLTNSAESEPAFADAQPLSRHKPILHARSRNTIGNTKMSPSFGRSTAVWHEDDAISAINIGRPLVAFDRPVTFRGRAGRAETPMAGEPEIFAVRGRAARPVLEKGGKGRRATTLSARVARAASARRRHHCVLAPGGEKLW
jgi:hypothetical protein